MTGKQLFVRSALTVALPFFIVAGFIIELYRGIWSAFRFAWLDTRGIWDDYRHEMRRDDY
jgi:hypothetical protein